MSPSIIFSFVLLVIGLGLTLSGLVNAVRITGLDIKEAGKRVKMLERLTKQTLDKQRVMAEDLKEQKASQVELLGRPFTKPENDAWLDETATPAHLKFTQARDEEYARHELHPTTWANLGAKSLFESQWLLERIFNSNKVNLWLLGGGIVFQTVAAILSLFN